MSGDEIEQAPATEGRRARGDASGPAIAATVALVMFSVFIGVFGPKLGNRQQSPSGVTLIEFADALRARSQAHMAEGHGGRAAALSDEEFAARIDEITDSAVALPPLGELGLEPTAVQRVRLPGGTGGLLVLRGSNRANPLPLTVAIVADEDRFTVYDRFSRPVALPEGEIFSIAETGQGVPGAVEIYRDGGFVFAVHGFDPERSREVVAAMRVANAELRASRDDSPVEREQGPGERDADRRDRAPRERPVP
ncbi:MAG: hypothetical protein RL136_394 [Planctomycetota bacterium]